MARLTNDPLLTTARVLLAIIIAIMIAAIVLVAIGVVAVLTVQRPEIVAEIAAKGLAPATYWGVVAGLLATVALLFLALRFASELREIVVSVSEGDPFLARNAERLSRMGWLALAIQLIGIPVQSAAIHLGRMAEGSPFEIGISGGGLVLVLTLFILARVFREGTGMRAELEGTV